MSRLRDKWRALPPADRLVWLAVVVIVGGLVAYVAANPPHRGDNARAKRTDSATGSGSTADARRCAKVDITSPLEQPVSCTSGRRGRQATLAETGQAIDLGTTGVRVDHASFRPGAIALRLRLRNQTPRTQQVARLARQAKLGVAGQELRLVGVVGSGPVAAGKGRSVTFRYGLPRAAAKRLRAAGRRAQMAIVAWHSAKTAAGSSPLALVQLRL